MRGFNIRRFNRYIICALFIIANTATSMGAKLTGKIIDGDNNSPIGYATISVLDANGKLTNSSITTPSGEFIIDNIKKGNYSIKISFIGFSELTRSVVFDTENSVVDIKTLVLEQDAMVLDEVSVVAQKSQMRFEIDRKVFDVGDDIASGGASASEALENIPSVTVDTEGNISLRNNSNVDIWINGRPLGLTGDDRAQYLEQLPAESLKSVEVLTNPSSKYSPEGSGGVLNLVLNDDIKPGYFGGVSISGNTWGGGGVNANFNLNSSKVDFVLNAGTRYMQNESSNYIYRETYDDTDTTILNQNNDTEKKRLGGMVRTSLTYRMTEKDDMQFSAASMLGPSSSTTTLISTDEDDAVTRNRVGNYNNNANFNNFTLDYNHRFSKTHNIGIYTSYRNVRFDNDNDYSQIAEGIASAQSEYGEVRDHNLETKIDYSIQLNKIFKLEAGYNGTYGFENTDITVKEGETLNDLAVSADLCNAFIYRRNNQALYANISGKYGNFGFQVGGRAEYFQYNAKSGASRSELTETSDKYWRVYPSLFLSYALPKDNELQLNYTNRVNRPHPWALNPYHQISDSTSISYGNPSLDPEFAHSFEFNHIKTWNKQVLSSSLFYRFTDGVIQTVKYYEDPVMYSTYENVTKRQDMGAEFISRNEINKIFNVTTTVNLYYQTQDPFNFVYTNQEGETESTYYDGSNNFSWSVRVMGSLLLPKDISIQATGNYNAKQILVDGIQEPSYILDLGAKKSFLNRKLNVMLSAKNVLSSRTSITETYGDNFYQYQENRFGKWQLRLTVGYKFGKIKDSNGRNGDSQNDNSWGEDDFGTSM